MRSEAEVDLAINRYADTIRRICFCRMKNMADTEDIFQEVFLKYMLSDQRFDNREHEKAWFIRVAINQCHDAHRTLFRRREVPVEERPEIPDSAQGRNRELLEAVLTLPEKYRDVIYLHYYEGYSAREIAHLIGSRENTVFSLLSRAREKLRDTLGGDFA